MNHKACNLKSHFYECCATGIRLYELTLAEDGQRVNETANMEISHSNNYPNNINIMWETAVFEHFAEKH